MSSKEVFFAPKINFFIVAYSLMVSHRAFPKEELKEATPDKILDYTYSGRRT